MQTLLEALLAHDARMIDAYRLAVRHAKDDLDRSQLAQFMADHERHLIELAEVADSLRFPAFGPDLHRAPLATVRVLFGAALGQRALFNALRGCDKRGCRAYARAAARVDLPAPVLDVLARALADEQRHRSWLDDRIASFTLQPHAQK